MLHARVTPSVNYQPFSSVNGWVEAAIAWDAHSHAGVTMFALSVDAAAHWALVVPVVREPSKMI
jgi:hypothetical protein